MLQLSPPWYPSPQGGTHSLWTDSFKKAQAMVDKMTLPEKVNVTTGTGWSQDMCVGNTGETKAGFPALCLQDGPLGLRFMDHSTAFPAGITVGATWNKTLMYERGRAHAIEAKKKGIHVLLGPAMGPFGRMPAGGRNWEGFGPDPVLQGIAAAETIKGIQDQGVIATAKHYIANEQEHFRQSFEWGLPNAMSSNIDDRTLHELYLWPFADSVKAGVGSVMCSYNMVNNSYACGNSKLLNGILKDELGFQGFVQSDWLAQRGGVSSALAGLDMTMPGDGLRWEDGKSLFGHLLTSAVLNGSIPMERLNDMAARVVAAWYQLGQDDREVFPEDGPNFSSWTDEKIGRIHQGSGDPETGVVNKFVKAQGNHNITAHQVAAEGTVLVKNVDKILPLSRKPEKKLRIGIYGEDAGPGKGPNACEDRACNQGTLGSGWGSGAVEFPHLITPIQALSSAFDNDTVTVTTLLTNTLPAKANSILDQDICIVFINSDAGEGFRSWSGVRGDRNDLYPQLGGDALVLSVAKGCGGGNSPTIVVLHAVGPVIVERWIENPNIKAVLFANLPGQESGNALASVLFGDVDASGRLPYTVGKSLDDYGKGAKILYYPNGVVPQQDFDEGLYVDYRHFDKHDITPRYEFGYGLSYTSFEFLDLQLKTLKPKTSPLPDPRPYDLAAPQYNNTLPDPTTCLFPAGFRKLNKYVYPFIDSVKSIIKLPYPYPKGYHDPQPPSPAGGGPGGNPSLFDTHVNVSVTVRNTGTRRGSTVVQVYVRFPQEKDVVVKDPVTGKTVDFPDKVLRGFEKVELGGGEQRRVSVGLTRRDLSWWSVGEGNWRMVVEGDGDGGKEGGDGGEEGGGEEGGEKALYEILVGRSSRDLPLSAKW